MTRGGHIVCPLSRPRVVNVLFNRVGDNLHLQDWTFSSPQSRCCRGWLTSSGVSVVVCHRVWWKEGFRSVVSLSFDREGTLSAKITSLVRQQINPLHSNRCRGRVSGVGKEVPWTSVVGRETVSNGDYKVSLLFPKVCRLTNLKGFWTQIFPLFTNFSIEKGRVSVKEERVRGKPPVKYKMVRVRIIHRLFSQQGHIYFPKVSILM